MGIIESKVNKYPLDITHPTFIVMERQKDFQYLRWLHNRIINLHNYHVGASFTSRTYDGSFASQKLEFLRNQYTKKLEECLTKIDRNNERSA
ncbi:hypothetical protein O1363_21360 [Bacteroides fragilis]|uniref:hypothetical protein n=1 Tax=Bacteroides fragilis TaxID=817 RepID=UPI0022AABCF0|nr:hypothetical protein [Bacteroides fragilis]MCZ2660822.1 hypothetical protein [Bacteroides fragilis]